MNKLAELIYSILIMVLLILLQFKILLHLLNYPYLVSLTDKTLDLYIRIQKSALGNHELPTFVQCDVDKVLIMIINNGTVILSIGDEALKEIKAPIKYPLLLNSTLMIMLIWCS